MWRPLLHFALLGAALFAVDRLWWSAAAPAPVVIDAARAAALRADLESTLGRPPDEAELAQALASLVDDALLHREALARGYAEDDRVVFRRLVQNLRFAGADAERDDASLFREALALGLHETDVVVRRRLVQRMRLELEARALAEPPDETVLRDHHARHAGRYRSPARVRLVQLYFAREHAGRAREVLVRLRAGAPPAAALPALGDPFLLPLEQPSQTREELADRFGADFAEAVFAAEPGAWAGPLASSYGVHLVRVDERVPARALPLDAVRERVRYEVLAERRRAALEGGLAALRAGVPVLVAGETGARP